MDFADGDRLICFTDGLSEARSTTDEEFGEDQLAALAVATPRGSANGLAAALTQAVLDWTGNQVQDDATLIVVERVSTAAQGEPRIMADRSSQ